MMIASGFIIPPFLVAFLLFIYQYLRINPERRLLNLRFVLMATDICLIISYLYIKQGNELTGTMTQVYLLLALVWFGVAIWMLRGLPPPKNF